MGIFRRLFKLSSRDYQIDALVSPRILMPAESWSNGLHVFCDLDKTYLETEFESWIKMAKIPFESPHDKITVPGASEALEMLRWGAKGAKIGRPGAQIHFVSSSPPQLRLALDGKLTLDRLEWASDTFKNQSYNIRMARIDLLRHHIAYKTKAILDVVEKLPAGSSVVMIGDNAEFDAFIYTGVRLYVERKITFEQLLDWLRGANVEESVIRQIASREWKMAEGIKVADIFIRSLPGYEDASLTRFAGTWTSFDSWLQIAMTWIYKGDIDSSHIGNLIRSFHNLHGVPMAHLRWCLFRLTNIPSLRSEVKIEIEKVLAEIATVGSSGPSRRMLDWDLDLKSAKEISDSSISNIRDDSSKWYHAIEAKRLERKSKPKNLSK